MNVFLGILVILLIKLFTLVISTMIFWGLGYLICNVFNIYFAWTIWHGLVVAIIYSLVWNLIKGGK